MRKNTEDDRTPTKSNAHKAWMPLTINAKKYIDLINNQGTFEV